MTAIIYELIMGRFVTQYITYLNFKESFSKSSFRLKLKTRCHGKRSPKIQRKLYIVLQMGPF